MGKSKPVNGECCSCGYDGAEETPCEARADGTHCVHWWDGLEDEVHKGER
jgi:hypothetical protein